MGVFTRVRDIIGSNISAMLERAEDPEKLIQYMLREMEDTLVEVKVACAGAMASRKTVERQQGHALGQAELWEQRARLAIERGREDLAREALTEKRRYRERVDALERELASMDAVVEQYKSDLMQLEEKIAEVAVRQKELAQRSRQVSRRLETQYKIRRLDTSKAMERFEKFQHRIDRMEIEAELANFGRRPTLDEKFRAMERDEALERDLEALKAEVARRGVPITA